MNYKSLLFVLLLPFLVQPLFSQEWVDEMMSQRPDYDKAVQAFEAAWKGKKKEKGKGYNLFRRWEYQNRFRLDKDGIVISPLRSKTAFDEYLNSNGSSKSRNPVGWENFGPNSTTGGYAGTGRINAVGFDPNNANTIYVGAAGGGVWKSTDGGNSWSVKNDFMSVIGVSAICVDPTNSNVVYIASGDGDYYTEPSLGVFKSTDGGETWTSTGPNWGSNEGARIRAMVMDPNDNNTLIFASNKGIYRTTNGGGNWTLEQNGNFYDIDFNKDANTNTFFAVTKTQVYKSTNNGDTWTAVYTVSGSNRLAIATTAANTNYVYVVSSKSANNGFNGLFRSTDNGASFTQMSTTPNLLGWSAVGSDTGGQGWYDLDIAASPANANMIFVGGVNTWKSIDGGANWTISSHWSGHTGVTTVHADKHVFEFQDANTLWEGNDGGIYKSTDNGASWTDKTNNLVISQMYRIGVSQTDNTVMAGLQDNGSKKRVIGTTWKDELGGDGMDCAVNPVNSSVIYGCIQYGEMRRSTNAGASWTDIQNNIPGTPKGAWVTPYILDPQTPTTIFAGYKNLYKSTDQGNTWTVLLPQSTIGGSLLTWVAISPTNSNYIYAGYSNKVFATSDGGTTWASRTASLGAVSTLKVSPTDPNTIYTVHSNYLNGNKIFKSTDAGVTWSNYSGTLPNIPAHALAIHGVADETLYIGMDVGVYYRKASESDWTLYNTDLPNVQINELEIKESTSQIYAATYGRGLWMAPTISSSATCEVPTNLTKTNQTSTTMSFSWGTSGTDNYEVALVESSSAPTSGTNTTALTHTFTGLQLNASYYFHIRTNCATSNSVWETIGPFTIVPVCGDVMKDRGKDNNYLDNQNYNYVLCPNEAGTAAKITFSVFNVESTWDALYIHNGNSINAPLFSSGNPATSGGFPAGGYYGSNLPGPFTSTADDGCLTIAFRSDGSVNYEGWQHTFECVCNSNVNSTANEGLRTLRNAIACTPANQVVELNSSLAGKNIVLQTPIVIDKDLTIKGLGMTYANISAPNAERVFHILPGVTVTFENFKITGGTAAEGSAILNDGNLTLKQLSVEHNSSNTNVKLVKNTGSIQVSGSTVTVQDEN